MTTDIELVSTAIAEFDRVAAGLAMLEKTYTGVLYEVDTAHGMASAKVARATLREPRYKVEKIRKDAKAPLLAIGKRLDAEAQRITLAIMKLEDPIDQQIKAEEERKERERLAREAAEAARVAALQARVDAIRALPLRASGKSAEQIKVLHDQAAAMVIGADYQELTESARQAHAAAVAALFSLHQMAVNDEADRERVRLEREELARLRADQARRDTEERERLAAERAAQDKAAAEARLTLEREQREQEATAAAERARIRAEEQAARDRIEAQEREAREAREAEEARIASERAELERQQEALRIAQQPKPRKKEVKRPNDEEIAAVLAQHYGVTVRVVCDWLCKFGQVAA